MTAIRTALVVGGGIAGPAVALALRKAGVEPVVYETRTAADHGTGAFLTVASNGIHALRVLDADRAVLDAGFPTPAITLRSTTGKPLGQTPTGLPLPDGTLSHTVKRPELHRRLRDLATERGVTVEYGRRLVEAREDDGRVRARFADGTEAVGDVLIGCDGVHSTVRRIIDPAAPAPSYAGLIGTGGYTRGVAVDAPPGGYEMIFGRRAFFGYAVASDGEVWWFANLPRRGEPARGELAAITGDQWRHRLVRYFSGDTGPAVGLIEATAEIDTMTPMHTVPRLPAWHSSRMVVVGDAAHAPSPSSGQGASLAFEDAVVLATCLRDAPDPATAFQRFEAARRPRVEGIIRWASRINSNKAAGPVARVVRDAMLPTILRLVADGTAHRQVFEHYVDWDAPVGS